MGYGQTELALTPNSYCIHYYTGTWQSTSDVLFQACCDRLQPLFGARLGGYLAYIYIGFQKHGFQDGLQIVKRRFTK